MTFGIIGNLDKPELTEAVSLLLEKLERSGMDYIIEEQVAALLEKHGHRVKATGKREACVSSVEMVVALGGDGTMLAAARLVGASGTPILGINLGKLGFLAELASAELQEAIGEIIDGKYRIERRLVLDVRVSQISGKVMYGLNDVVLNRSGSSRLIDVEVSINDAFAVSYRADGLIISTPTGSTAYALSCGGPIVVPTSSVIGITPISPHTLSGRPLIVPDTDLIRVITRDPTHELLISVDGQEEAVLRPPVDVYVRRAAHTVNLVKRQAGSYYDVLRAKLLWGRDARGS
jgi:NAD+ kinase